MRRLTGGLVHEVAMASRNSGHRESDIAANTMYEMLRPGRTRASSVPAVTTAAPIQSTTTIMVASSFVSLKATSQWPDASSICTPRQTANSVAANSLPTCGRTTRILPCVRDEVWAYPGVGGHLDRKPSAGLVSDANVRISPCLAWR